MINLCFSASKRTFFRGGIAIAYYVFAAVFSLIVFQMPIGLIIRIAMILAIFSSFFLLFCGYCARLICNKHHLVVLTPFTMKVFSRSEIENISYVLLPSNYYFSFTLKMQNRQKKTFHFITFNNQYGSYNKIVEEVTQKLNELTMKI